MNRRAGFQRPPLRRSWIVLLAVAGLSLCCVVVGAWWGMGAVRVSSETSSVGSEFEPSLTFAPSLVNSSISPSLAAPLPRAGSDKKRRPSDPFITGDLFRSLANIVVDETTISSSSLAWGRKNLASCRSSSAMPDDLRAVSEKLENALLLPTPPMNSTVFVQTHLLSIFSRCLFPKPPATSSSKHQVGGRLVLLTHNSDYSAPWSLANTRLKGGFRAQQKSLGAASGSLSALYGDAVGDLFEPGKNGEMDSLRPPLSGWYGQNLIVRGVKGLGALPIGIENRYNKFGRLVGAYEEMARLAPPFKARRKTLLVSFSTKTNPQERKAAWAAAEALAAASRQKGGVSGGGDSSPITVTFYHQPSASKGASPRTPEEALRGFLTQLSEHQFVLAPKGHGVDTHRLWEAMYMGCVPIALDSPSLDFEPRYRGGWGNLEALPYGSRIHPQLPLWVLPNTFVHTALDDAAALPNGLTSEGDIFKTFLVPERMEEARGVFTKWMDRGDDDDSLKWLLGRFPLLSADHWRSMLRSVAGRIAVSGGG